MKREYIEMSISIFFEHFQENCHPIVSLSRSICNLVNANKLSTLSVGMLREICESLGLNVDDIKQRRKKPLIEQISRLLGSVRAHESDSSLIEQLERQLRGKINVHSDVSGVPRFACSSISNVTQIPRH